MALRSGPTPPRVQLELLRQWVREQLEDDKTIAWKVPVAARAAAEEWQGRGEDAMQELLQDVLEPIIYRITLEVTAESRSRSKNVLDITEDKRGRQFIIRSHVKRTATEMVQAWFEHAKDGHVRLMKATKEQLEEAVHQRTAQASTQMKRAAFLQRLADGMVEGQTVEEAWGVERVAGLYVEMLDGGREV